MAEKHNIQLEDSPVLKSRDSELAGSRIMVVEDSAVTRRQLRRLLEREGFEVLEAKSGEEALWLAGESEPDLILLDVMMDGIDGFTVCKRILSKQEFAHIPVIFLTGLSDHGEIVRGFEAGAVDYITKPFHPAEGISRISLHLKHRRLLKLQVTYIDELENLNTAKDRLLRVASHDLRNPLTAITGLVEFLQEGLQDIDPDQKEMLDSVHDASIRMTALINNLLDLSALDHGKISISMAAIDLGALIEETTSLYSIRAKQKNIGLSWTIPPERLMVQADRTQIQRVLDNLISNAIKFTPPFGEVQVNVKYSSNEIRVQIEDSGPGVCPEDAGKLFAEFGKTRNPATAGEAGSGLGLNICQRIVQMHRGRIAHINREEGGSCFFFTLPTP